MNPYLKPGLIDSQTGFSLVELIIVIAVLGVISAYAVMSGVSPAEVTLPSQAQTLASNIRQAQTLAFTSGSRMRITAPSVATANANYTVTCVTTGCNTSNNFSATLNKNVTLAGPASNLEFSTLGQPSATVSYALTSGSTITVCVALVTGLVSVITSGTCP